MKKIKKFLPNRIFVREEKDGKEKYFLASKILDDIGEDDSIVGIYQLVDVYTCSLKSKLERCIDNKR